MKLSLVVMTSGKAAGQTVPITLSQFIIGRDPQCNLRPASPVISKRHCAILLKNGKVFVRDFDSTNGTFVNDQQVKGERQLNHEDILKVGPLAFRVVMETTAPVNKPTPPPAKLSQPADDESVAAMLLSLQDDTGTSPGGESQEVPTGSTIMDIVPPTGEKKEEPQKEQAKEEDKKEDASKPAAKKADPPKPADTRAAAAAILEKYTRRQRG